MVLSFPVILSVSTIVETRQLGDPGMAGIALTLFNIGGLGMAAAYGKLYSVLKKWTVVFVCACTILSEIVVVTSQSIWMLFIGMILFSSGLLILPSAVMDSSEVLPPEKTSFASGLMAGGVNIGVFLSSYFIALVFGIFKTEDPTVAVWSAMACLIVVTLILVATRFKKEKPS
jgi:predicted MFS family arabinose efflux permease